MPRGSLNMIVKGPIVEGKTAPLVAAMIRDVDHAYAEALLTDWRDLLRGSVRKWTGAYGRAMKVIHTAKQSKVGDSGKPYGMWLEGTSRRNKTTRFKGYAALKRAKAQMQRGSGKAIAEKIVHEHVGRF
jgi:hypothetical protein